MEEPASLANLLSKNGWTVKQFVGLTAGIFGVTFGGIFVVFGWLAGQQASGAAPTPVPADLAKLEAGQSLPNIHVQLGRHLRLYPQSFFWYESIGHAPPTPGSKVHSAFIPLISTSHPYAVRLQALAKKRGGLDKLTPADLPPLPKFIALLHTDRYDIVGNIPPHLALSDTLHGLVNNHMVGLEDEERDLIKRNLSGIDADKILIIWDDKSPASDFLVYLFKIGGAALLLAGIVMIILAYRGRAKATVARRAEMTAAQRAGTTSKTTY